MKYASIICTPEERDVIVIFIESSSYIIRHVERDVSGVTKLGFDDDVDLSLIYNLIKNALRNHKLKGLANYDDLNILQYTPTQIANWIENNVTTLAQAKTVLKALTKLNLYLLKRLINEQ